MRRIGRWAFNGLAVVSLLLCLATSAVWIRSGFTTDGVQESIRDPNMPNGWWLIPSILADRGCLFITYGTYHCGVFPDRSQPWHYFSMPATHGGEPYGDIPWCISVRKVANTGNKDIGIAVRLWTLDALAAMLPIAWLARWRQQRRLRGIGTCLKCGYNLIGNLSGVCPECGAKIVQPTRANSDRPTTEN
jgi:hypothetical protein